jgi:hypothetical protein
MTDAYQNWVETCLLAAERVQTTGPGGRAAAAQRWAQRLQRAAWQMDGHACAQCGGSGRRRYGNGSTWRGGMGVASMTEDICNGCWGSGRKGEPWTDLRKLQDDGARNSDADGAQWFADHLGASMTTARGGFLAVAAKLRRVRGLEFWAQRTADMLADLLDRMAAAQEED